MSDTITIVGTVGTDPEKKNPNGVPITTFRVATKDRRFDRTTGAWIDGETNWYTASAYRRLAEHAFESLHKRDRVILTGRLRVRHWDTGEKRGTSVDIDVDAIGHDLLFGTTTFAPDEPAAARLAVGCFRRLGAGRRRAGVGEPRTRAGGERRDGCGWICRRAVVRGGRGGPADTRSGGSGDAVLRRRGERSGWRTLDSNRVPPPRASSGAPRGYRTRVRRGRNRARAGGLLQPRADSEPAAVRHHRVDDRGIALTDGHSERGAHASSPRERRKRTFRCSRP